MSRDRQIVPESVASLDHELDFALRSKAATAVFTGMICILAGSQTRPSMYGSFLSIVLISPTVSACKRRALPIGLPLLSMAPPHKKEPPSTAASTALR